MRTNAERTEVACADGTETIVKSQVLDAAKAGSSEALGKLLEDLGCWDEAARLFEHGLQCGVAEADFGWILRRLSILQKRRGDFDEAVRLWEKAASEGHIYAYIEMAKYYEHKLRDVKTALKWTKSAWEEVERADLPAYVRKHWLDEITHRLKRLERKDRTQPT